MSIFSKLRGTLESIFQIGKGGKQISSGTTDLSFVDTDGSTLIPVKIGEPTEDHHAASRYWVRSRIPLVTFNFDGSAPPAAGTNINEFGFCHTSGGVYVAGYIYYDDGTSLVQVFREDGSRMINVSGAFSGTAGSFVDDNEYFYDTGTSSWRRVGPLDLSAEGAVKAIKVDITTASVNSTNSMPANSIVQKVILDVTTAYAPAATTINVGTSSDGSLLMTTAGNDNDPTATNTYIKEQATDIGGSASPVVVTIDDGSGGAPTAGAGSVIVYFSNPLS